jgi:ribosome-associated protein
MNCEYELQETEFIELYGLLKRVGACETGGHAKSEIGNGQVKVDGFVETRKRCKIRAGQIVTYGDYLIEIK